MPRSEIARSVRLLSWCLKLLPAALLGISSVCFAQASLEVLVLDQSTGAPIVAVPVNVQNVDSGSKASATTNDQGKTRFSSLSTGGQYVVSVPETARHYELASEKIVLRSNFERSVTLSLAPKTAVSKRRRCVQLV